MSLAIEILFVAMLAVGAFFSLVGSIGLLRLSDFLRRLHGPTKATTLGVGGVLLASIVHHAFISDIFSLRELLITLFLFLTAPVSAHMLAKAALALEPSLRPEGPQRRPGMENRE
jgi:multicomponent K+:H+ antiporter subunit G